MRWFRIVAFPFLLARAAPALAQNSDPFEQAVQGSSEPLPASAHSGSPDADLEHAQNSDNLEENAGNSDAQLEGVGHEVRAHAANPDSITTGSQDVSDLPSAASIDQVTPAAIAPPPPLPEICGQPVGDKGWSSCLSSVNEELAHAQARLDSATAAYSRSITMQVPTGEARLVIIQERDAAQAQVDALSSRLAAQVAEAQEAGVSSWVTSPYKPHTQNW